jgi:hypothetical protein
MGTPQYYFGHRPETRKVSASPFQNFIVRCAKCGNERLKVKSELDEMDNELAIFLVCPCGQRERLKL